MTNDHRSNESEIPVYLGLGSNIGDREANLREAIARIEAAGIEIKNESSVYETEPVGFADQPWFLNQVIETRFLARPVLAREAFGDDKNLIATIQAEVLLSELLQIEREMGRQPAIANGPRVIDIDLLLIDRQIINYTKDDAEPLLIDRTDVIVPHPRLHQRRFVLEPLCEIAPKIVHPVLNKTCREMLASLDDKARVRPYRK